MPLTTITQLGMTGLGLIGLGFATFLATNGAWTMPVPESISKKPPPPPGEDELLFRDFTDQARRFIEQCNTPDAYKLMLEFVRDVHSSEYTDNAAKWILEVIVPTLEEKGKISVARDILRVTKVSGDIKMAQAQYLAAYYEAPEQLKLKLCLMGENLSLVLQFASPELRRKVTDVILTGGDFLNLMILVEWAKDEDIRLKAFGLARTHTEWDCGSAFRLLRMHSERGFLDESLLQQVKDAFVNPPENDRVVLQHNLGQGLRGDHLVWVGRHFPGWVAVTEKSTPKNKTEGDKSVELRKRLRAQSAPRPNRQKVSSAPGSRTS